MESKKRILLLDDDPGHLQHLALFLAAQGYHPMPAEDVDIAQRAMSQLPCLAIVDLYLDGDQGDHLSNDFIEKVLIPAKVPYGRMTSAPMLVPEKYKGDWVLHKRDFRQAPEVLLPLLIQSIGG